MFEERSEQSRVIIAQNMMVKVLDRVMGVEITSFGGSKTFCVLSLKNIPRSLEITSKFDVFESSPLTAWLKFPE
jgi:uncharacterized protein (UPF0216 family)